MMQTETRSLEKLNSIRESQSRAISQIRIRPPSSNSSKARAFDNVVREEEEKDYMDYIMSPKENEEGTSPLTLDRIETRQSGRGKNSSRNSHEAIALYEVMEKEKDASFRGSNPMIQDLS